MGRVFNVVKMYRKHVHFSCNFILILCEQTEYSLYSVKMNILEYSINYHFTCVSYLAYYIFCFLLFFFFYRISPSRRFYISPPHYGCEVEYGYIAVITEYAYSCSWDNWPEFSTILFSPTNSHEVWSGPSKFASPVL